MGYEKDALFYSDLIYEIKELAGFYAGYDEEIEKRIEERKKFETEVNTDFIINIISDFNRELYTIINRIMLLANSSSKDLTEIAKYPDLVKKEIKILEAKIDVISNKQNINAKVKVLKK